MTRKNYRPRMVKGEGIPPRKHVKCLLEIIKKCDGKIAKAETEIKSILGNRGTMTRRTIESLRDCPDKKRRSPTLEALSIVYNEENPNPEQATVPGPSPVHISKIFDESVAQVLAASGIDTVTKAMYQRQFNRLKVHLMDKVYDNTEKPIGMQTGIPMLDKAVGGFSKGEFTVLSGNYDPIEFLKTEIIYQLTAKKKIPILYWCGLPPEREEWYGEIDAVASSVEHMTTELMLKDSGVDAFGYFEGDLRDEDRKKLKSSAGRLSNIPLYMSSYRINSPNQLIIDRSKRSIAKAPPVSGEGMPEKLANQVRAWNEYEKGQPCLVMVNSLRSHGTDVEMISRGLSEKARELSVPIVAFVYNKKEQSKADYSKATNRQRFSAQDYDFYSDLLVLFGGDEESISIESVIHRF